MSTQSINQPSSLSFLFKRTKAELPGPKTILSEPGSIDVIIDINGVSYGPYDTGIRTTFGTFDGRRYLPHTEEMDAVNVELYKFIMLFHNAHTELKRNEELMDGLMIMAAIQQLKGKGEA